MAVSEKPRRPRSQKAPGKRGFFVFSRSQAWIVGRFKRKKCKLTPRGDWEGKRLRICTVDGHGGGILTLEPLPHCVKKAITAQWKEFLENV
jgi:hypothetical protein